MVDVSDVDSPVPSTPLSTPDSVAIADDANDSKSSSKSVQVEVQADAPAKGNEESTIALVQPTARRKLIDGILNDQKNFQLARKRGKEDVHIKKKMI